MTRGKFEGLTRCSDSRGVITALAVDHRANLLQAIAQARGEGGRATAADLHAFKGAVTRVLSAHASAILLDPEYGLDALPMRATRTGALLAYEQSGYDLATTDRLPDLLSAWSVRRLVEAGAQAIKILLYYNPYDREEINRVKQAYVERIGAECSALDIPFFLEPLVYDATVQEFARQKPRYVAQAMREFSRARYAVDILKVELPIEPAEVIGMRVAHGQTPIWTRQEACDLLRETAVATSCPFIYLSGGSSNADFSEMLALAGEAGVRFSGVLCGRAIWQDGITVYARGGLAALTRWLEDVGTKNIQAVMDVVERTATPWWDV